MRGPARRLVIDNDWAGDPDGLLALAHHLLSSDRVDGVTSSLTSPMFPGAESGAARGIEAARALIAVAAPEFAGRTAAGAEGAGGGPSEASRLIVDAARRDDPLPLTIVCAGPLTNVAAALAEDPSIAARARLVWVGGAVGDVFEYNRDTDREAAAAVFATEIAIEQYPLETYRACTFSLAELEAELTRTAVGRAVWDAFTALEIPTRFPVGEVWHLGDSLPLLATSLAAGDPPSAPRVVHTEVDFRLIVGDMAAKFALHDRRLAGASRH